MSSDIAFSNEITLGDLVSSLSFLAATIGLLLNWWQYRRRNKTDRAMMLRELYSPFFLDKDLFEVWTKIENPKLVYERDFFGTDVEKATDRLLGHCDTIAVIYRLGSLSPEEMSVFDHIFERVFKNKIVQRHFRQIDEWTVKSNIQKGAPFSSFRVYCESFGSQRATTKNTRFSSTGRAIS